MQLTELLDLEKTTLMDMLIPDAAEKSGTEQFVEMKERIAEQLRPVYVKYLEDLNLIETLDKMESYDDVIRHETDYTPMILKKSLAEALDKEPISIAAKAISFEVILLAFADSGYNFLQPIYHKRLQQLAVNKFEQKGRIITDLSNAPSRLR